MAILRLLPAVHIAAWLGISWALILPLGFTLNFRCCS